jgi:hypothetical protein
MRPARAIQQPQCARSVVALEPLIAGFPTDLVLRGELGHRKQLGLVLTNLRNPHARSCCGTNGAFQVWMIVSPLAHLRHADVLAIV